MHMKTIIILGGSGYIGQHLMQQWLSRESNITFYCVSRRGTPKEILPSLSSADIRWVSGDVLNADSFIGQLPASADVIVDLVGTATGKTQVDFDRMNAEPVKTMVALMDRLSIPAGAYASGLVGMPGSSGKFVSSKKKGEEIARKSGKRIAIVRPSLVYGDRKGVGAMVVMMKFVGIFSPKFKPITVDRLCTEIIDGVAALS